VVFLGFLRAIFTAKGAKIFRKEAQRPGALKDLI
jgi:hypothetical protein